MLPGLWGAFIGTYEIKQRYGRPIRIDLDESPIQGAFYIGFSWTFACLMALTVNPGMVVWIDRLAGPLAEILPSRYMFFGSIINITVINMCVVLLIRKLFGSFFSAQDNVDLPPEVIEEWEERGAEQELDESGSILKFDESGPKVALDESGDKLALDDSGGHKLASEQKLYESGGPSN
jgi:hypothetical protein